ncbi:hypothetical protein [uncultured Clostridium sp.]|jgi:hypothetical protein|uniref:hypothetical protein n=1 Tax=uncultured Clostridium sp. TaxID=59620 RepID=UPI0026DAF1EB|nr:hypothetical protein [uncultured Clostridium sp.]
MIVRIFYYLSCLQYQSLSFLDPRKFLDPFLVLVPFLEPFLVLVPFLEPFLVLVPFLEPILVLVPN